MPFLVLLWEVRPNGGPPSPENHGAGRRRPLGGDTTTCGTAISHDSTQPEITTCGNSDRRLRLDLSGPTGWLGLLQLGGRDRLLEMNGFDPVGGCWVSGVHLFPFWRLGSYQCLGVGFGVEDGSDDSEPVLVGDLGRHADTGETVGRVDSRCLGVVGAGHERPRYVNDSRYSTQF